jgi:3-hydroxyacyl-CoA dehydrogenase
VFPEYASKLVSAGSLGRKTSGGLYKTEKDADGNKRYLVFDIPEERYREKQTYPFQFAEDMIVHLVVGDYIKAFKILIDNKEPESVLCLELLLKYIIYSLSVSEHIGYTVHAADDAMAAGFNWCPPLALIEVLSGKENVLSLVKERLSCEVINTMDIEKLFSGIEKSHYDYRPFIRAKR